MKYFSSYHIDSVAVDALSSRIAIGLSALEGNTWDGGVTVLTPDGVELSSRRCSAGVSMIRFIGERGILTAKDDGDVIIYSSDDLVEVHSFGAHDDIVSCIAPDQRNIGQFLSCGYDGNIFLWDAQVASEGSPTPLGSYIQAHYGHVNEVAYSSKHANLFCSAGYDGLLRVWDTRQRSSGSCSCIVNLGQIGSSVSFGTAGNDKVVIAGTDAGDIIVVDVRCASGSSGSGGKRSLSETCSGDSTSISSSGVLSSTRMHRGRVRRLTTACHPVGAPGHVAGPPGFSSTATSRENLFLSASDDMTYALCKLSPTDGAVKEVKRFSHHQDYVTDLVWLAGTSSAKLQSNHSEDAIYSVSTDRSLVAHCFDISTISE
jgi:WD40 repeat protein